MTKIPVQQVKSEYVVKVKTWWDAFMEADFISVTHPDRTVAMKLYRAKEMK